MKKKSKFNKVKPKKRLRDKFAIQANAKNVSILERGISFARNTMRSF